MSGSFITNKNGRFLSEIISSILPKTQNTDFLVGYFYFSGFTQLYKGLRDKRLRVLVGLEIEQDMLNRVREVDYHTEQKRTRGEIKATFYDSLKDLFNETDYFDTKEQQEAFSLFLGKIKDGSLEIRKTKEANHSKMYLFEYTKDGITDEGGTLPGTLITGSSNLTYQGLKGRLELNAILRDKSDFEEGQEIFNELWQNAIVLADKDNIAEFESSVIQKIWYDKLYSPYCFFIRVLDEYFQVNYSKDFRTASEITGGQFYDLKYQTDATRLALATIETHNGVIVSDVVGLGKSIIGSVVANNLGLRTIIIAPPHLAPQWEEYRSDFNFNARVYSSGRIESALNDYREKGPLPASPSGGGREGAPWLIIVDEAHKYRNEYTQDYNNLSTLCRNNKVMLLTATPFNNRPADIYSMVKLFQLPAKSTLQTVDNLGWRFNQLMNRYNDLRKQQRKQEISEKALQVEINAIASLIRQIISPLVIRRSRLDLMAITEYREDLDKQGMGFAKVQDPQSLEYDLGSIQDLYIETLEQISPDAATTENTNTPHYLAARYNAVAYVKADYLETLKEKVEAAGIAFNLFIGTQGNLAKFMRHLLVQRFESSKKAFEISLDRMIKTSQNILNWIDKRGKVPIFKRGYLPDIEDFYTDNTDTLEGLDDAMFESELEKEKYKDLFEIETQYLESAFIDDIQSDIAILKDIQQKWFGGKMALPDPKKEHFAEILKKQIKANSKRKIVVFSSFADTINDLYDELHKSGINVFKYTSNEASKANKETIRLNFDAGVKPESQEDKYDVLVATDAISEGYNLHRAGTIFNYDIPYNPTRVIQRVGRINRINKKVFEELYIYNYFPTAIGENETKTKEIATLKMAMINAIIGEDTKVLTPDIELQSYFAEQYRSLVKQDEVENWETRYREILNKAKWTSLGKPSTEYETALAIPHRSKVSRTVNKGEKGILVFGRKKDTCVFKMGKLFALEENEDTEHSEILTPERAFELLEADIIEQAHPVSEEFDSVYQNIKANLFTSNESLEKIDKQKRAVLDKITAIQNSNVLPFEYTNALMLAAKLGALSGFAMRFITQIKPKDYKDLPLNIEQDFLDRVTKMSREVDEGKTSIILSEELR